MKDLLLSTRNRKRRQRYLSHEKDVGVLGLGVFLIRRSDPLGFRTEER